MKKVRGTILLVEDEYVSSVGIADKLCDSGYRVIQGYPYLQKGLQTFLEMLETYIVAKKVQLILMDIKLGKKFDGVDLTRDYLKKFDLPVVYITGYPNQATVSRAKSTEPYGFVIKPYSDAQLLSQVELAMYLARLRKFKEENFRHDSLHDELTGLPNRKVLMGELNHLVLKGAGASGTFAVIFSDLDKFKEINDQFGHLVGDQFLREVALRLQNAVKQSDLVVRFGGDEFVFIIRHLDTPTQIHQIAERIIESLREPIHLTDHTIQARVSLGIAMQESTSGDAQLILKHADTAMYDAKKNPGLRYSIYTESDETRSLARLKVEEELKKSIHEAGLKLSFRPILRFEKPKIIGLDLSINWKKNNLGLLSEEEYNETAERTGLTIPMTVKILYAVTALLETWADKGLQSLFINIKLGERFLDLKEWDKLILLVLSQKKITGKNLGFEIRESSFLKKVDKNTAALAYLRERGFNLILEMESASTPFDKVAGAAANFIKFNRRTLPMGGDLKAFAEFKDLAEKAGKTILVDGFGKSEIRTRLRGVKHYLLQKSMPLQKIETITFKANKEMG